MLDIGFGPGARLAVELAERAGSVHGIDPSEAMLELASGRPGGERVTWSIADALDLGVEDASFDAAVSTQVYEYVTRHAGGAGAKPAACSSRAGGC